MMQEGGINEQPLSSDRGKGPAGVSRYLEIHSSSPAAGLIGGILKDPLALLLCVSCQSEEKIRKTIQIGVHIRVIQAAGLS
jgi:hypothetical protein